MFTPSPWNHWPTVSRTKQDLILLFRRPSPVIAMNYLLAFVRHSSFHSATFARSVDGGGPPPFPVFFSMEAKTRRSRSDGVFQASLSHSRKSPWSFRSLKANFLASGQSYFIGAPTRLFFLTR